MAMVSKGATKTSGRRANNSAVSGAKSAPSPCVILLSRTRFLPSTHPSSPSLDRNRSTFGFGPAEMLRSATRRMTFCPFAVASEAASHVAADALSSDRRLVTFVPPRCLERLADRETKSTHPGAVHVQRARASPVPPPPRILLPGPCDASSGFPQADVLKHHTTDSASPQVNGRVP
jgi:hypothetical protein